MSQYIYQLQDILDEATINNEPHYLIKWQGLSHQNDTWEPISNLTNVVQYLQYWINKRRAKDAQKNEKNKSFSPIKQYLYSGQFLSKKKTTKEQYRKQILTKQKIWQQYLKEEGQTNQIKERQQQFLTINKDRISDILQGGKKVKLMKQQDIFSSTQQIAVEQPKNKQSKKMSCFEVVGVIDTSKIANIIRMFLHRGMKCLQVQALDGTRYNMMQEDIKQECPELLVEFYESNNISF